MIIKSTKTDDMYLENNHFEMGNPVLHRRYYLAKMNPCVVYVGRPCERYRQGHHVKILQFAPFFTLHTFFFSLQT